jgi:hypothetical protein
VKYNGVSGKFYNLVKSYLDRRYQKAILSHNNCIESTWKEVNQGINFKTHPFLIHINDFLKLASVGTKILLYTDDTRIIVTSPNLETFKEQSDIIFQDINNWFKVNQLVLNHKKKHVTYNSL